MLTVAKFGGSSLADADQFRKVAEIVKVDPDRRVIVVSAPGKRTPDDEKITDLLYRSYRHTMSGNPFSDEMDIVANRFLKIQEYLDTSIDVIGKFADIQNDILHSEPSVPEAYAASRGEYITGMMLADYLGYKFLDAAGFIFFDENGKYQRDDEAIRKAVGDQQVVIPGFYGIKPNWEICTFSRGGSDLTGAIVARALRADLYENWTDVSGLRMANPKIVDNPRVIHYVTHREMRELSYMGASVFHEEAMFPVQEADIPTQIRNTNDPSDPGTLIVSNDDTRGNPGFVTGISGRRGFTGITIDMIMISKTIGVGYEILSVLKDLNVSFEHMPGGVDYLTLIIDDQQLVSKLDAVIEGIQRACPTATISVKNIALIVVVGRGMVNRRGTLARLSTAIENADVNIRISDQGMMEHSILFGVDNEDCEKTIRAIYDDVTSDS